MTFQETTAKRAWQRRGVAIAAALVVAWFAVEPAASAVTAPTTTPPSRAVDTASPSTVVNASFLQADFMSGEMVWLRGQAFRGGKVYAGAPITVERKKNGTSTWGKVWTTKTSSTGWYNYRFSPSSLYTYRVRITGTSTYSKATSIVGRGGSRTLEEREASLGAQLGSATTAAQDISADLLPSGVSAARYREYSKGILVEVTTSSATRTWYLYDRIGAKYESLGRWKSRLGLPMRDMKCSLLESGCVQRFYGGALYSNGSSMSRGVYAAYGTMPETEVLAAAYSQVGYEEPSWRVNKYTKWLGSRPAWCMTFTAWAAAASGNASWVPKSSNYTNYVATLKKSGRLHYSGKPPVGAALLLDWGSGKPSHSALLTSISGKYIYTLEGNTTDGSGDPQRGVYHRKRLLTDIWAWYIPSQP